MDKFFNDSFFMFKFDFFHNIDKPYTVNLDKKQFNLISELFANIHKETIENYNDSEHFIRSLLYHLLIRLNRLYGKQNNTYGLVINNIKFLSFRQMLEKNIREKHSVQDYANALKISRTYLNKLSKEYLGDTSKNIIRKRLLLEAKKELLYSQKDINEISYELNFSEPPNFFRFFKQLTGISPLQYRKEFSEN